MVLNARKHARGSLVDPLSGQKRKEQLRNPKQCRATAHEARVMSRPFVSINTTENFISGWKSKP
jgi:hypothetical protein